MTSSSKLILSAPSEDHQASVRADTSIGLDCVRYEVTAEHLLRHGVLCLDPTTTTDLLQLEGNIENEPDAIAQQVAAAMETFLRSLWMAKATTAQLDAMTAAADRGLMLAQFSVGLAYEQRQEYATALQWYRKAAVQGLAPAEHNIGIFYATGRGVEKDMYAARDWFLKAIEHGAADSHYMLGLVHSNETGDLNDQIQAYADFTTAAALLYDGELRQAALDALTQLKPSLSASEIVAAEERSANWLQAHPEY